MIRNRRDLSNCKTSQIEQDCLKTKKKIVQMNKQYRRGAKTRKKVTIDRYVQNPKLIKRAAHQIALISQSTQLIRYDRHRVNQSGSRDRSESRRVLKTGVGGRQTKKGQS
jgi:ADP-glucose pyrophosphorylase